MESKKELQRAWQARHVRCPAISDNMFAGDQDCELSVDGVHRSCSKDWCPLYYLAKNLYKFNQD